MTRRLSRFPDSSALSLALARYIQTIAHEAIQQRSRFNVAFSGGSLPKTVATGLAQLQQDLGWSAWHIYYADERSVPLESKDSNHRLVKETVMEQFPIDPSHVHTIDPQHVDNPEVAAEKYAASLQDLPRSSDGIPQLDLVLLGIGPDGHTCSLFPGHPLLAKTDAWVAAITDSPKPPPARITLTFPVVNHSHHAAFVVTGEQKQDIVKEVMEGEDGRYPCQMVRLSNGRAVEWYVDDAAAAKLAR